MCVTSWDMAHTIRLAVESCASLERLPSCNEICRWPGHGQRRIEVDEEWPMIEFDTNKVFDEVRQSF